MGGVPLIEGTKSAEDYKGFCEITITRPDTGTGVFSDTNLSDVIREESGTRFKTAFKTFELKRYTEEDAQLMDRREKTLIGFLVREKLDETK